MMSMTSLAQLDGDTVWGEADDQNGLQGVTPAIEGSNARDTAAKALAALDKMGKTFAKLDALTGRKGQGAETEAKQSSPFCFHVLFVGELANGYCGLLRGP